MFGAIFGSFPSATPSWSFAGPEVVPDVPAMEVPDEYRPEVEQKQVARRRLRRNWAQTGHAARDRALERWRLLVAYDLRATKVGRTFIREAGGADDQADQRRQLEDVFGTRSTSTLAKRAGPLLKFVAWCGDKQYVAFPVDERYVYEFLRYKADTGSPTFCQQMMEALVFAKYVIGLEGVSGVEDSSRCRGLAAKRALHKRPVKQMQPLTSKMVEALEVAAKTADCLQDRVLAGQCLFCLYARARWSDAQNVEALTLDGDPLDSVFYLEGSTKYTKTSNLVGNKNEFLPMVVPGVSLTSPSWVSSWLEARKEARLVLDSGVPLMPVLLSDGSFGSTPLTSGEANRWIRELLLQQGFAQKQVSVMGTHSFKATLLSWAANFGIKREQRQILGYHSVPGLKTVLHYSRDEQAVPLRSIEKVIKAVAKRTFDPDATRSGRFAPNLARLEADSEPAEEPPEEPQADQVSSSSGTSSSTSGSSSSAAAEAVAKSTKIGRKPARNASCVMLKHRKLHTLHCAMEGDDMRLACGRALTPSYSLVEDPSFEVPLCGVCFGTRKTLQPDDSGEDQGD